MRRPGMLASGKPVSAEQLLAQAQAGTRQEPSSFQAWLHLGQVHMLLRQPEAACAPLAHALSLNPDATEAKLALAAACIHLGQDERAVALLRQLLDAGRIEATVWYQVAHQLLQACLRLGQWVQARQVMSQVIRQLASDPSSPKPLWCDAMRWRLDEAWWQPIRSTRVSLTRVQPDDAPWLKACFQNEAFANAVNRSYATRIQQAPQDGLAKDLARQLQQSPVDSGSATWRIECQTGDLHEPVKGLAAFVNIDAESKRSEFIVGFPQQPPPGNVVMEMGALLAHWAFNVCQFHKVTASIYADNPRALSLGQTLQKLGFHHEGTLRQHVRLKPGVYVDLRVYGGLGEDILHNRLMQQCMQRYLR